MTVPAPAPPVGDPPEDFPAPWASDWGEDPFGPWQALTYRGARQAFRWCPPGRFLMGSPPNEHGRYVNEIQHEVVLTRGFWIADTACTQALWEAVMGRNPSGFPGARRPVEMVSWKDAEGFIERLNAELEAALALPPHPGPAAADSRHAGLGGQVEESNRSRLRLPTESEWEYACRAGTTGPFSFGDDIDPGQVNYNGNHPYWGNRKGLYRQETVEVASLPPNPWGLYEMHGNLWEWCRDWFGDYPEGPVTDPVGPVSGGERVLRGGGWISGARSLRSAYRYADHPGGRYHDCGFRLALGPEPGQAGSGAGRLAQGASGSERKARAVRARVGASE